MYIDVNIATPYKLFWDLEYRNIFINAHCFSLKLIVFHLGFNGKSKIWKRIYRVNKNLDKLFVLHRKLQDFNDNLRKSYSSENQRLEQTSIENHVFSKEN